MERIVNRLYANDANWRHKNRVQKIPYISAEEVSMDSKPSLTLTELLPSNRMIVSRKRTNEFDEIKASTESRISRPRKLLSTRNRR